MGWKVPFVVLGVLVFLGLAVLGMHFRLDAGLDEHRRECLAIQQKNPVNLSPRPAILEPEEPGNVWELLNSAFDGMVEATGDSCDYSYFDRDGTGEVPRWVAAAGPSLDLCRRAARRRDRTWKGSLYPDPRWDTLTVRALSTKGLLLWRQGRDAEAAEWMLVALTVATDAAALRGNWSNQRMAEREVFQDLRDLLSQQSLTAAQLEDVGRRLNLLRALRAPFASELQQTGAWTRQAILESRVYEAATCDLSGEPALLWNNMVGWRDFWSVRYAKVRVLDDIRSCGRDLERVSWADSRVAMSDVERIFNTYQGPLVAKKLPYRGSCCQEEDCQVQWNVLSVAVACARFQAIYARLPRSWEEAGIPASAVPGVHLGTEGLRSPGSSSGNCLNQSAVDWPIGRRK